MFTGLIQTTGSLQRRISKPNGEHLGFSCNFQNFELGESIAVNGVCLTLTAFSDNYFECDASSETLARSNLGTLPSGARVNLERALRLGDRLGGHIVSGHVDATGRIERVSPSGDSLIVSVSAPKSILDLVVKKGSIAVDGASLTVNDVSDNHFSFMLIPHSQSVLKNDFYKIGKIVNLETDLIGKYVQKLLSCTLPQSSGISRNENSVTMDSLRQAGFLGF